MAYTASALSFMFTNLAKPVVVTGSQLPISELRTDAVQNFVNAVLIAGYRATGLPCIPEVVIAFGDVILRGNRARKMSVSRWQGFDTPNYPALGTIGEHIRINESLLRERPNNEEHRFHAVKKLVPEVMDVGLFPGFLPSQLKALLDLPNLRGIVLRTFGAGNAPGNPVFLKAIGDAIRGVGKPGRTILNVTQCPEGMVEMGLYAASSGLIEEGVISGLDMTPEAALAKMMWTLSRYKDSEDIQPQLQIDQRGEQSQSLFDVRYGSIGSKDEPLEVVHVSAQPSGQFRKELLKKALLRISGIGFSDTVKGEEIELRAFIHFPDADADTPVTDSRFAASFKQAYEGSDSMVLLEEITKTFKDVVEPGAPINVTLVPMGGKKIWYKGLYMTLFTSA